MTSNDFRALRKSMGMTQHTLAGALLMGKSGWQSISDWETGKRAIPGPVQIAVNHLANCKPEQIGRVTVAHLPLLENADDR